MNKMALQHDSEMFILVLTKQLTLRRLVISYPLEYYHKCKNRPPHLPTDLTILQMTAKISGVDFEQLCASVHQYTKVHPAND